MYEHYIALDWSKSNMAIARTTKKGRKVNVIDIPSNISYLKDYLKSLKGKKILTFEEGTSSQWLYSELKPCVNKLLVCDPYRNRLLSEGAKNDKIDATKLVYLNKAGLLKEVYHSGDDFIHLRKLVSGYNDIVKSLVRLKNQRSSVFLSVGLDHKKDKFSSVNISDDFVLSRSEELITQHERIKQEYVAEFKKLAKKKKEIRLLKSIPGISDIHAVQIMAVVVDMRRFPSKGQFLSYCGLIKHEKISGGKSYGKRSSRCYRPLKRVFKMAAHSVTQEGCSNPLKTLYEYYMEERNKSPQMAKHNVSRRLAILVYGVLKSGKKYDPKRREKELREKSKK